MVLKTYQEKTTPKQRRDNRIKAVMILRQKKKELKNIAPKEGNEPKDAKNLPTRPNFYLVLQGI